ncbi:Major Facilitator Superfamily protein [Aphelenchoides bicaudatus]|nr:Major Facilitator Superfamily protein [Aphelenchoides bicaudatus]
MSVFSHRFRYLILLLSLICLSSISSNMSTFNFAIICLDSGGNETSHSNSTIQQKHPLAYTPKEQSILMWALGVGSMIGTFPFSWSYSKFGARWVFASACLLSAISTAVSPLFIMFGFWWHAFIRFIQGISYAADFAIIGLLCSRWSSLDQLAFYISVLTCYGPLSTSFTYTICEAPMLGWRFIYYIHGLLGLLLFVLWIAFYTDFPAKTRFVSGKEREIIERGKNEKQLELNIAIPYWEICKNPLVLVIWLNAFVEIGTGIFLMSYTPLYLRNVHKYSVHMTGLLSSASALFVIPARTCFGFINDRIRFWSELTKINIFNTCSLIGPAICYTVIGFASNQDHALVFVSIICIYACYATSGGGFYKSATVTCREYSQFVIATMQFIKCITLFAAPAIYALCVHDTSKQEEWRLIFFMMSGALLVSGLLFLWVSDDKPLPFTDDMQKETKTNKPIFVFGDVDMQKKING